MIKSAKAKRGCEGCIYLEDESAWKPADGWLRCIHEKECSAEPDEELIFIASNDGN